MVKVVEDYIDEILEKFPYLTKKEIMEILKRGFRVLDGALVKGVPVMFDKCEGRTDKEYFYIGRLEFDITKDRKKSLLTKTANYLLKMGGYKYFKGYFLGLKESDHLKLLSEGKLTFERPRTIYKYTVFPKMFGSRHIWMVEHPDEKMTDHIDCLTLENSVCIDGSHNKFF